MNKHLTLLLLTVILIGSCRKDPATTPPGPTEEPLLSRTAVAGKALISARCNDGNILAVMRTAAAPEVKKISAGDGSTIWSTALQVNDIDTITDLLETNDGKVVVCGISYANDTTLALIGHSANGDRLWSKQHGQKIGSAGYTVLNNGNILATAFLKNSYLLLFTILNDNGDEISNKSTVVGIRTTVADVMQTGDNNILVTGVNLSWQQTRNPVFVRLNGQGDTIMKKHHLVLSLDRNILKTIELENGELLCAGIQKALGEKQKGIVMRLNNTLDITQTDVYGNASGDVYLSDITTRDGGYTIVGSLSNTGQKYDRSYMVHTNGINRNERIFDKVQGKNEHLLGLWNNGAGYLLLGVSLEGNGRYHSFLVGMDEGLERNF